MHAPVGAAKRTLGIVEGARLGGADMGQDLIERAHALGHRRGRGAQDGKEHSKDTIPAHEPS